MKKLNIVTHKPWGRFYYFAECTGKWRLKLLFIKRGRRLSLQKHTKRSEFWVVAEGKARVQKGAETFTLASQGTMHIAKKELHRITALTDVVILAITFGPHYERDIVRLADDYGRTGKPNRGNKQ
jgi:mannose-6-phosphate isomerase-like protein (cupin superfamily)